MPERALIVGCGRIAGGFNEKSEDAVLTHALAYKRLGVTLAGCCDRDAAIASRFAARWQADRSGTDLKKLLAETKPSLVSICTPPEEHLAQIEAVLAAPSVRSVLIEKPVASTAGDARKVEALAMRPLWVNYFRAFDPFYQRVAAELPNFGRLVDGTARYYGRADVNAVHWLERVLALFGEPAAARRLSGSDAEPLFEVEFAAGGVTFLPSPDSPYSPFELDLLFEKRRVRVLDSESRVEHFAPRPDPAFGGYFNLATAEAWPEAPSRESILLAVKAALAGGTEWQPLLKRSILAMEILERVARR